SRVGGQDVPRQIYRLRRRKRISISAACTAICSSSIFGQIPKNTLTRRGGQNGRNNVLLFQVTLPVIEDEEERFVLFDWTAEAAAELVAVLITLGGPHQILKPALCVERRIFIRIEERAMKVIRSRSCLHPDLRRATPEGRVDVVGDDLNLFHQVGAREHGRIDAVRRAIAAIGGGKTIASRDELGSPRPCKVVAYSPSRGSGQIEDVTV